MSQGVNRCLALLLCLVAAGIHSGAESQPFRKLTDILYAKVAGHDLLLDLYLPSDQTRPAPLVVFVHGGAWRSGSKQRMPLTGLVRDGFAVASADYRLSPAARFPAQIHFEKDPEKYLADDWEGINMESQHEGHDHSGHNHGEHQHGEPEKKGSFLSRLFGRGS